MRVLVVEDDKIIGDGLVQGLRMDGYAVDWVESLHAAEAAIAVTAFDAAVIDLGLPDGSGLALIRDLRQRGNAMPVLILTAYDDVHYKVQGLDSGADDYLVKPFKLEELLARLRALRRRRDGRAQPRLEAHGVVLDPARKTVSRDGVPVHLGAKEFVILHLLMEKRGQVLARAQIEESLYGWNMEVESNTVEVHVHGLRKKLGRELITTVRNFGYRIEQ